MLFGVLTQFLMSNQVATGLALWQGVARHRYQGIEALLDGAVRHAYANAILIFDIPTLVALLAGGLLSGVFAGFAARLWR